MRSALDSDSSHILADYLSKRELAAQLNRTVRTIDRMALSGDGSPATKIGRTTLYRREAVLEWLKSREVHLVSKLHRRGIVPREVGSNGR